MYFTKSERFCHFVASGSRPLGPFRRTSGAAARLRRRRVIAVSAASSCIPFTVASEDCRSVVGVAVVLLFVDRAGDVWRRRVRGSRDETCFLGQIVPRGKDN